MKVLITGPRSHLDDDRGLPYMHLTVDLDTLPREGEHITLNGGGGYTVVRRMWYVTSPENEAYWARGDYEENGEFEAVHLDVEPDGYRNETYTLDGARREGYLKGHQDAARELAGRLSELEKAGILDADVRMAVVLGWLAMETGEVKS